jgi:hypothetical protein
MLNVNVDNVSLAKLKSDGLQSGMILSDLTEERKKELSEQARLFVSHTDMIGQQDGSLDAIHNSIQKIGKDFLEQSTNSSLNNEILQHTANLANDDSIVGKTMKEYQSVIADLNYEENLISKNPVVRTINRLPGAYFIRKKMHNFQIKLQNGKQSIEALSKKVDGEVKLVESYIAAMGQEHKNQTSDVKKSFEYIYYMTAVQEEYEKKIAVLRENNENDYAEIIEKELLTPLIERQRDLKTIVLAKMMNAKSLKQLQTSSQAIIKELVKTRELAMPVIAATMINLAAAQQNERALRLIGSTREVTSTMIKSLSELTKENQKSLQELSSTSVVNLNDIIKAHNDFKQLEIEHDKFQKERLAKSRKALEEVNIALSVLTKTTEEHKAKEVEQAMYKANVLLEGKQINNSETTDQTQAGLDMTKYEKL